MSSSVAARHALSEVVLTDGVLADLCCAFGPAAHPAGAGVVLVRQAEVVPDGIDVARGVVASFLVWLGANQVRVDVEENRKIRRSTVNNTP